MVDGVQLFISPWKARSKILERAFRNAHALQAHDAAMDRIGGSWYLEVVADYQSEHWGRSRP
jgi:hypothetical protein